MSALEVPLALIASVDRQGSIGRGNELVWDEPADKRWFRQVTMGCPVIMGRKTWDSLPERFRPLPGRLNVVLTRQAGWLAAGAQVARDLTEALALARRQQPDARRVFVIGGGQLFAEALPLADELVLTEIDADLPGDTHFPDWPRQAFTEVQRLPQHTAASQGQAPLAFAFVTYQRQR
ncbi:dihydrofolate reductase [Aquabacterium sp. OR-4]|uniref:dihydrofolate reductase n=1 Tax=Aquabacterium sp. OR-4 TaxID=2978127 RepID=UPI0021B3AF10|nr:dihydrofolate reductase [Aquabacterium sp. OR-4]MDT7835116.1 dihydrofolate reductase [Aquabacterium sp. OR-4]